LEPRLDSATVALAAGHEVVCAFVNDRLDAEVVGRLKESGVRLIALRCAGYNNVDLKAAAAQGVGVVRVPAYSPNAVAEHALGLMLCLNRHYHRSFARLREGNFSLDGLLGFDMHGKTVGVVGTGRIGQVLSGILKGMGCRILAHDTFPSKELAATGVEYVELQRLYEESDIISLHCPLTQETFHIVNEYSIAAMKKGVMIVNTSRGPLIDTEAVIVALKAGKVGYLGLDVYEEEQGLFFEDLTDKVIQDDMFVRLQAFPNVLITAHQAFFTKEAVANIAATTMENVELYLRTGDSPNRIAA
jgi:D-lactate dehydrogenase